MNAYIFKIIIGLQFHFCDLKILSKIKKTKTKLENKYRFSIIKLLEIFAGCQ